MSTLSDRVAELRTITGCAGGFVMRDGTCLASSLPPAFEPPRLARVANNVRKLAAIADKAGHAGADFVLRYGKATLLVVALGEGAFLMLACEPGVSIAAVEVFASVAADDVREALAGYEAPPASMPPVRPTPQEPSVPPAPVVVEPSPAERLDEARRFALARFGREIGTAKALLIHEVGPIGEILFQSALDGWLSSGPPDWGRARALCDVLAPEIEDAKGRAAFTSHPVWG